MILVSARKRKFSFLHETICNDDLPPPPLQQTLVEMYKLPFNVYEEREREAIRRRIGKYLAKRTTYALSECHGHNNMPVVALHLASNSILAPFNPSLARFSPTISLQLYNDAAQKERQQIMLFIGFFFSFCYYILIYFSELFTSPQL